MLDIQIIEEKDGIFLNQSDKNILIKVHAKKDNFLAKGRAPVNVCFVIDVSGSMNDRCVNKKLELNPIQEHFHEKQTPLWPYQPDKVWLGHLNHVIPFEMQNYMQRMTYDTKLSRVKTALKNSLSQFNEHDSVSIVLFSSNAHVLKEGLKMTDDNKKSLMSAIESISANGGTNIYDGWLSGAKEVAKKLTQQSLNRVLLLTDGENNQGIQDITKICQDISKTNEKNISLSTFGVGDKFNENFLQKIANAGGGNSYYIENPYQADSLFKLELSGLSNMVASQVKLSIDLHEAYAPHVVIKNKNQFNKESHKEQWDLTNLIDQQTVNSIFELKFSSELFSQLENIQEIKLGKISIQYKDNENHDKTLSSDIKIKLKNKQEYEEQDSHSEFKVQDLLVSLAQQELEYSDMIKRGEKERAINLMNINAKNINELYSATGDARLSAASANIIGSIQNSENQSLEAFSKSVSYTSYARRTGKNI